MQDLHALRTFFAGQSDRVGPYPQSTIILVYHTHMQHSIEVHARELLLLAMPINGIAWSRS